MTGSIDQAAISLGMATLMGACIGFERQWRQRMAGLQTNTLVAIGAASFVVFEGLFPDDGSPTRRIAGSDWPSSPICPMSPWRSSSPLRHVARVVRGFHITVFELSYQDPRP
jgi:uncharacterized membrane protein YhiD involved in acid resistance